MEGESYGMLGIREKERGKVWKDHMESIMNDENDWDHNVGADVVERPVVCIG